MVFRLFGIGIVLCVPLILAAPASNGNAQAPGQSADSKVCVDRETLVVLKGEPEYHFKKAHENFVKKDMKTAADEIRKAANFIKLESEAAAGETKQALADSEQELKKLADGVEKGAVKSVKEVDGAFARARSALGKLK